MHGHAYHVMVKVIQTIIVNPVEVDILNGQIKIGVLIIVLLMQLLVFAHLPTGESPRILEDSTKVPVMHAIIVMQNAIFVMVLQMLLIVVIVSLVFKIII